MFSLLRLFGSCGNSNSHIQTRPQNFCKTIGKSSFFPRILRNYLTLPVDPARSRALARYPGMITKSGHRHFLRMIHANWTGIYNNCNFYPAMRLSMTENPVGFCLWSEKTWKKWGNYCIFAIPEFFSFAPVFCLEASNAQLSATVHARVFEKHRHWQSAK
jgi:hypothetical protein